MLQDAIRCCLRANFIHTNYLRDRLLFHMWLLTSICKVQHVSVQRNLKGDRICTSTFDIEILYMGKQTQEQMRELEQTSRARSYEKLMRL